MLYVDEVIGRGSFGTVYRGRMKTPDGLVRRVAVKVLSDEMSADTRAVGRFRDEARLLALIDHPGLVPVYALERFGERWAVVMGYVDGFELARASRMGPVPPETVRQIGVQIAEILDALWTHPHPDTGAPLQVVHRDVKPHNLMIDHQGRVRLLDFGVARARFEARESTTVAGEVAGTLAYMSPQRWARRDDGHAGDVYALGATLYQLATGRLAQEAGPYAEDHAERVRRAGDAIPAELFGVIEACLAFDDAARPDAATVAARLREIGPLSGPDARSWAQGVVAEQALRASGGPDGGLRDSGFLGEHRFGSDNMLTTRFHDSDAVEAPVGDLATLPPPPTTIRLEPPPTPPRARSTTAWSAGFVAAIATAVVAWSTLAPDPPDGPPVKVALAPTHPLTLERDHADLRRYLEGRIDRPIAFTVGASYEATADLLVNGEVDVASLPHGAGLRAMARHPDVRPLATKLIDGTSSVDPYLVIRRDDPGRVIADFVGSTVCYADPQSNTGYHIPRQWIASQGFDPDVDFGVHLSGDHAQVLRDVLDGTCRMAGTFNRNLMTADARGIPGSQLKVFALVGDSIPHDSWYAGPATDPALATAIAEALQAFDPQAFAGAPYVGEAERISGFRAPPHAR